MSQPSSLWSLTESKAHPPSTMANVSPDGMKEPNNHAPNSDPELQAVPPSPTSDHSLNSISDNDESNVQESHPDDQIECDQDLDVIDDTEFDVDEFYDMHIAEMATLVSLVLADIVNGNDQVPFSSDKLTRFHSRAPPSISIRDYLLRIIKFCNLDKAVLLVLLYLVDLFSKSYPNFVLNSLTVHRFLIIACTVTAKGLCDQFCSNVHYAKVGGVSVMELNLLEVEFLTRVQYRIVPDRLLLPKYFSQIKEKRKYTDTQKFIYKTSSSSSPKPSARQGRPASSEMYTGKHSREESAHSTTSASDSDTTDHRQAPNSKPTSKLAANKGLKAMKDTFRFLQPSKKKRSEG